MILIYVAGFMGLSEDVMAELPVFNHAGKIPKTDKVLLLRHSVPIRQRQIDTIDEWNYNYRIETRISSAQVSLHLI